MLVTIHITKDILFRSMRCKKSEPNIGQNCAIGLAIFDLFRDKSSVEYSRIDIFLDGYTPMTLRKADFEIPLPHEAIGFILSFDAKSPESRLKMDELSFNIDIPDDVIDLINIDEVKRIIEKSPSLSIPELQHH